VPSMAVIASSTGWRPANEALGCGGAVLTEFFTQSPLSRPSVPRGGSVPLVTVRSFGRIMRLTYSESLSPSIAILA
jgi:hypothetical protein